MCMESILQGLKLWLMSDQWDQSKKQILPHSVCIDSLATRCKPEHVCVCALVRLLNYLSRDIFVSWQKTGHSARFRCARTVKSRATDSRNCAI